MKRKRKNNGKNLGELVFGLIELCMFFIKLLIKTIEILITFSFNLITYIKSGYGKKSGNSFFKCLFDKGVKGEFILYKKAVKHFGKDNVLTNIYLPSTEIDTTEIDVLAISNKTIYCFEMKNYAGYIYGSQQDINWTQALNKHSKYKFYNPIKQNIAHEKALMDYLNVDNSVITPAVIFSNASELKKINCNYEVMNIRNLSSFIKKNEQKTNIIDDVTRLKFLDELVKCSLASDKIKTEHVKQIKDKYYFKELD